MGGCASRPKDLDSKQEPLIPAEDSTTPKKAEGETVPQEDNGGETKKEEPLVDPAETAPVAAESEEPAAESKLEAVPEEPKEKAAEETKKAAEETEEEKKKEGEEKPKDAPAAAPSSGDKSDAPLVTL